MKVIERLRHQVKLTAGLRNGLCRFRRRPIPNNPAGRQCRDHAVFDSDARLSKGNGHRAIQGSGPLEVLILLDAQNFGKIQIAQ